ncbi:MAG: Gfo/Idh/MocA family oxidoreductase [Phycisphaerae bacterium]
MYRLTRRAFLAASAAVAVVPPCVLGGPGHVPPSDVLTRAGIGTGAKGLTHVRPNPDNGPTVQLAVCDVDRGRLGRAREKAGRGCRAFGDFRRLLDSVRPDVVVVATPPHWHALVTLAAVRRGRDVLCEKPMTRFIAEGRAVADAARRYGRVVGTNTLGRDGLWRTLRKAIAAGVLGRPLAVRLGPSTGFGFKMRTWLGRTDLAPQPVPADLDYDLWLGPAPAKPYHPHRVHRTFRGYWDYDGGGLTDVGQHWVDAIQYALAKDDSGPVRVEADAPRPAHPDAVGPWRTAVVEYADGTHLTLESGAAERFNAAALQPFMRGPDGAVVYHPERRRLTFDPPDLADLVRAYRDPPATIAFEEAVRTRSPAPMRLPDAEAAHRSVTVLHLVNLSIRLGRSIRWNPQAEEVLGDPEAGRLVHPPLRPPWHL